MSNQEVADLRVLRNSVKGLSPFPLKACLVRIIDFHFLSTRIKFWPPNLFISLHRVIRGGNFELLTETVKQTSKQTSWQI